MEVQRRLLLLNQQVKTLENENTVLRQRLSDVINGQEDVESYMKRNGITDMLQVNGTEDNKSDSSDINMNGNVDLMSMSSGRNSIDSSAAPPVPPRSSATVNGDSQHSPEPSVGTRLEGLLLDEFDDDFNPRAFEKSANDKRTSSTSPSAATTPPALAPPPKAGRDCNRRVYGASARADVDEVFGSSPSTATPRPKPQDPFGMGNFSISQTLNGDSNDFQATMGNLDKRLSEMKDGFSRGLAISAEDFSLESLDPLK